MTKRNKWATQGRVLILALMKRAHTYAEMNAIGVSVCPHKRVVESLRAFPNLRLEKGERKGLTTWRVVVKVDA